MPSAAGWPGWYSSLKSVRSGATRVIFTPSPPATRVGSKIGDWRRYGSPSAVLAVESALAMFSAITRIRACCARSADAATFMTALEEIVSSGMD